jgi:tRNA(fMet)-specific endonuclease VapC
MNKVVLDTDTLSAIMRQDSTAISRAQGYLSIHPHLTISIITRFEILRGLYAKSATSQIAAFHTMCQSMEVLPLTDAIVVRAADIYGTLHQTGQLVGDADILVAATCLENGCEIVTNNTTHFSRIQGLVVQNWLV